MQPKNKAILNMICCMALAIFAYFHNDEGASISFYFFVIFSILYLFMAILFRFIDIRVANILSSVLAAICLILCAIFLFN